MNYQAMKALAEADNGFYSVTQTYKDATYEIFNYRLCSYEDFFNDEYSPEDTLNMRGTMFRIDTPEPELVSLPLMKYFNANENPYTMDLDFSQAHSVIEKIDGSLISTWLDCDGWLQVKSKASLFSDQAIFAQRLIENNAELCDHLRQLTEGGFTVNLEYCAPDNRIVLYYPEPRLYLLALRGRSKGDIIPYFCEEGGQCFGAYLPKQHNDLLKEPDFLETVRAMQGIEGYVVHFPDKLVKAKTSEYVKLHAAKDSVYNLRNLADIVLHEEVDDLYQLFEDDEEVRQHIHYYEKYFVDKFNHTCNMTYKFHKENKELDRKSYAIKGQQDLDRGIFGYAMSLYLGKEIEDKIKQDIVKSQKAFGE